MNKQPQFSSLLLFVVLSLLVVSCKGGNGMEPTPQTTDIEIVHTYVFSSPVDLDLIYGASSVNDIYINGENSKNSTVNKEVKIKAGKAKVTFQTKSVISSVLGFSYIGEPTDKDIVIKYTWEEKIEGKVTKSDEHEVVLKNENNYIAHTKQYTSY